ncbi:PREDICTED: LOB domain-containing protein 15-like [Ipomoea nil]|uniref:LOB domain-containing protein 15-like n=1 Tax=Ipomoea nil TaxID=35883 RepID=UPI000900968C|nr:PREDICTED: LOB domain-containing protein 15-like [Ipomoea nil]
MEMEKKLKTETEASPSQTAALNTVTPCAACKLLRRRCVEECPFSPYFSPHEPHKFAAVHKVFGASNVSKLIMEVPVRQRADAANSLVYEANVRLRDPVYGCMGAISALQQQLQYLQSELNSVKAQLLRYKYRQVVVNGGTQTPPVLMNSMAVSVAEPPQAPPHSSPSLFTTSSNMASFSSVMQNNNNISFFQ